MKARQDVPAMREVDEDVSGLGFVVAGVGYDVYSWSPGAAGAGVPSTQVHLVLTPSPGVKLALRLKSARALDELVGVLLQHRADVWGPK